ncbi:MAG: hypothetical protein H7066_03875 [Cytophagaceae bacterium]|nr:hypothetical protein [Gemmatimonadaceae bacterium]
MLALALALSALSCGDSLGPGEVEGRYVLESVSAAQLPVTLSGDGWSYRIVADTIWFDDDGRGTKVHIQEWNGRGPERFEQRFDYRYRGGRVEVTYVCPPNASCIEGPHLIVRRQHNKLIASYSPHMQGQGNPEFTYRPAAP